MTILETILTIVIVMALTAVVLILMIELILTAIVDIKNMIRSLKND